MLGLRSALFLWVLRFNILYALIVYATCRHLITLLHLTIIIMLDKEQILFKFVIK
jgi:hypothetical protein